MKNRRDSQIPFLFDVDVILVGGGLAGLPIARFFSERGKSVLLVEGSTFLGWEIGLLQRPWVSWQPAYSGLASDWLAIETGASFHLEGSQIPLHMDRVKRRLEDQLLETGVHFMYASRPISVQRLGSGWEVVIGNKSGRQAARAQWVLDASETGLAGRLLAGKGCRFSRGVAEPPKSVRRVFEFTHVHPGWGEEIRVPPDLGAVGSVRLHQGAYDAGHVLVEIAIPVEPAGRSSTRDAEIEFQSRNISFEVASYLVKNETHFHKARLGWGAHHVLYGEADDPLELLARGEETAAAMWDGNYREDECLLLNRVEAPAFWDAPERPVIPGLEWREENEFNNLRKLPCATIDAPHLPVLTNTGVLVAGGGTSGAVAAYSSGREGVKTAVLEMNGGLGGTATYGAVSFYWFGHRNAFTGEIDRRVMEWNRKLGYVREDYLWGRKDNWNPEIRAFVYLEFCRNAGVEVFFDCIVIGSLCRENLVQGAVVATPYGPRAAIGRVCIDATGDGDLAAFAGAESTYGNDRDRMPMWASVGWFSAPGTYRGGNFATSLDCGDVLDYTRFLLAGRRRGAVDLYDHATYLAPRETRHILGDIILTLDDQLLQKEFDDVVSLCLSNHDTKGKSAADVVYRGLLPPHLEIQVPYRAFLPRGLEGLLVTGKALSCTHDALSALRMIDDLQQQGGAVGTAAALAVSGGVPPREIDVRRLQRKMIRKGLIPRSALQGPTPLECDYRELIEGLSGEETLQNLDMNVREWKLQPDAVVQLFLAAPKRVLADLQAEFSQARGAKKLLLAKLLLWHGDEGGTDEILAEIRKILDAAPALPERQGSTHYCQLYPDHGVMTELTYLVNFLAGSSHPGMIGILTEIVDRIEHSHRDYRDLRQCIWNTIEAIAYVAERQPQSELADLLRRLLALPELCCQKAGQGLEIDLLDERLAYLVIILARALARCGEKDGLTRLASFCTDSRIVLARCAVDELIELTGFDCGVRAEAWASALASWPDHFGMRPWTKKIN